VPLLCKVTVMSQSPPSLRVSLSRQTVSSLAGKASHVVLKDEAKRTQHKHHVQWAIVTPAATLGTDDATGVKGSDVGFHRVWDVSKCTKE
jgi:hypothetical protein